MSSNSVLIPYRLIFFGDIMPSWSPSNSAKIQAIRLKYNCYTIAFEDGFIVKGSGGGTAAAGYLLSSYR